jgi:nucleotide-binding universal stress UspA family protein
MSDLLVPFDNSPSARRALDHAVELARQRDGTRLRVLAVLDAVGVDTRELVDAAEIDRVLSAEASAVLDPARAAVGPTGVTCTYHSATGMPAQSIAAHARQHAVDQIVMGTRGLGTIPGLLLGSVAQRVVLLAGCPVTLVK